jgi:hypothetical protein
MDKKRGMRQESKPTAMQVDKEVSKQVKKTVAAKAKKLATSKASVKVVMAKNTPRRERQEGARAGSAAKKAKTGAPKKVEAAVANPPTKKVVKAAVNAMKDKGFSIPQGMQMKISFVPAPGAPAAAPQQKQNSRNAQPKAKNVQQKANNDGGAQNTAGGNRRRGRRGGGNNANTN